MRAIRPAIVPLLLLLASGCASLPGGRYVSGLVTGERTGSGRITQQELREALLQYASRFEATIIATADTISAGTKDPVIQRRTLRWKLGVTPVVNQAAFMSEPESAYVAMLTVATSMHEFLTAGTGADAFGDQQKLAVDASAELLAAAVELGDRFLTKKELARVTQEVEALVRAQPMRGEFVAEKVQSLVTASESSPIFDWVTAIPLSPFRALQGVDQGAQAIREFNDTAMEMTRIVAAMPRLIRWNLELLTLDISQQGDIEASLESFRSLASSAELLSQTAQSLPESLRELLDEAERTGQSLGPLSQSLERTATAVAAAGTAWAGLVQQLDKPPADPSVPSRPFDIREWQQTAAQVTSAATELRAMLESLQTFAESDSASAPFAQVSARIDRVEQSSRELVNLAALRGLQLILVFFALLFVYRRIEGWLARRSVDTLRPPLPRDRA
jgi:hypothetical protein